MTPPKIVVVGSSNTDMVVRATRIPAAGETVLGTELMIAAGGKGANQAVAAARLGAEVTLVARVGRDDFGDRALDGFRRERIRTDFVLRDDVRPSGVALIIVDQSGENAIAVAAGANSGLCTADVDLARRSIEQADVLLLQLEIPLDTVRLAARVAWEAGVSVILNPAPGQELEEDLLRSVTVLTPNETEAKILTGVSVEDAASARKAADILVDRGVRHVVITLGAAGAAAAGPDRFALLPGRPVEVVDTTAAGDAFNGALACALARGDDLEQAVQFANLVGALCVTRRGAQPSLPTAEHVEEFARRG